MLQLVLYSYIQKVVVDATDCGQVRSPVAVCSAATRKKLLTEDTDFNPTLITVEHKNSMQKDCRLRFKPITYLLQGKSTKHCFTVLPNISTPPS